jgi:hypothetical protein
MHNHGEVSIDCRQSVGIHGHCHVKTHLSGCGIMAKCRPSAEHRAAIPSTLPLGFNGYSVVGRPRSSAYRNGTSWSMRNAWRTSLFLNTTRPATKNHHFVSCKLHACKCYRYLIASLRLINKYRLTGQELQRPCRQIHRQASSVRSTAYVTCNNQCCTVESNFQLHLKILVSTEAPQRNESSLIICKMHKTGVSAHCSSFR